MWEGGEGGCSIRLKFGDLRGKHGSGYTLTHTHKHTYACSHITDIYIKRTLEIKYTYTLIHTYARTDGRTHSMHRSITHLTYLERRVMGEYFCPPPVRYLHPPTHNRLPISAHLSLPNIYGTISSYPYVPTCIHLLSTSFWFFPISSHIHLSIIIPSRLHSRSHTHDSNTKKSAVPNFVG